MKFKLSSSYRYWWPVRISVPHYDRSKAGTRLEMSFKMQFEALPREEALAIAQEIAALPPEEADKRRHDDILRVVKDWDEDVLDEAGQTVPFSRERLAALMEISWFRIGVYTAWNESVAGEAARKGN